MRYEVLKAVTMKMIVLSDVTTCSLVYIYRQFGDTCCLQLQYTSIIQKT
jgi:hypothetical protein